MAVRIWVTGPFVVSAVAGVLSMARLGTASATALFAAGLLFWTLLEYLMHRFAFHGFAPHYQHHAEPGNPVYIVAPWWLAVSGAALVWALACVATSSTREATAILAGVTAGYGCYELIHLRIHSGASGGPLLRALRRRHFHHHFHDHQVCYGVTTPLWDWFFRSSWPAKLDRTSAK